MILDPIADLLTRIRNGSMAGHSHVLAPYSRIKVSILEIFQKNGFIASFEVQQTSSIRIALKYTMAGKSVFSEIKRVSKSTSRRYFASKRIPRILSGAGLSVLSTSKGVLSDADARRLNVGGELLCYIY
jgi:small subunit ribosomal protein S8